MKNDTTNIKSPYFRNTLQADEFEDKVHMLRDKPHAIAIGFDSDPNITDCNFEIACRKTETENELISALVYVVTKIMEKRGFRTKVIFAPIALPEQNVQIMHAQVDASKFFVKPDEVLMKDEAVLELAEQLVDSMNPTVEERNKISQFFGFFKKKPPEEPTNV